MQPKNVVRVTQVFLQCKPLFTSNAFETTYISTNRVTTATAHEYTQAYYTESDV